MSRNEARVSVIMPVRNAGSTVRSSLASTLKALGPDDEVLVGLHDCLDESDEQVRSVSDSRVKIHNFKGGSLSDVLNALVHLSENELIARMDADDICLPWRFQLQKSRLRKHPERLYFSSALVLYTFLGLRLAIPQYMFRLDSREVGILLPLSNPLNHPTLICQKSVMVKLGMYRNVPGEDFELWLRALKAGLKLERSALPTIIYRISPGQMSRRPAIIEGWQSEPSILNLRREMIPASLSKLQTLGALRSFKLRLQLLGFPTLRKISKLSQSLQNLRNL